MNNAKQVFSAKNKSLKLLLFSALLLLGLIFFLLINNIRNSNQAQNWVNQANVVRFYLAQTLSMLKDMEADQRGFLLSNDSSFLVQYEGSEEKLLAHINHLHQLVSPNEQMTGHLDKLDHLIQRRIKLLNQVLAKHENLNQHFQSDILAGQKVMEAVERQLQVIDSLEGNLLQQRTALSQQHVITTPRYATLLTVVALAIILYAFYRLRNQLRLSKKYLAQSRAAEEQARKNSNLLETAKEITGIGYAEWNRTKNTLECSKNFFRLFGYEPSPALTMPDFLSLVDENDRNALLQELTQERRENELAIITHFWATRKDGQRRCFKCYVRLDTNIKGHEIITTTAQDVTDEFHLRRQAHRRANFIELIVENNVDMIAAFDNELRTTVWNKAFEVMFQVPRQQILGKKLIDVFPYLEGDMKMSILEEALKGKETLRKECKFFKNNKTGEISFIPLREENGSVAGVLTIIHDITEIKEAEQLLKENNIRFEYAEQAGKLGSFQFNPGTRTFSFSHNLYRLLGYEPNSFEPSFERFLDAVHPDDRSLIAEAYGHHNANNPLAPTSFRVIRKDGSVRFIKSSVNLVQNEKGETLLFGSLEDITEEDILKQQLQQRKDLIESLVENSADMISLIDNNMQYTIWNNACERKLGLSKKDVLGKNLLEIFPQMADDKSFAMIQNGLAGTATNEFEYTLPNGLIAEFSFVPIKTKNDEVAGLLIMAHDITERKQAAKKLGKANTELHYRNKALQEAYSFNRHITDLAPNAIFVYDIGKQVNVYENKRLQQIHGFSTQEIAEMGGDFLMYLLHPEDLHQAQANRKWYENTQDNEVLESECRIRNKQGEYRHLHLQRAVFKRNANGAVEQIIGVALDITDLKRAEQELTEKNQDLLQVNEELASFNFIASHDLQEPLRKIQTFGSILEQTEKELSENGKSNLKRIQLAAVRMRTLINDLLSFSSVSMAKAEPEQVNLNDVLEQALFSLQTSIEEKSARIFAGKLPEIQGIPFQLQQLFENLIGNAVKYGKPDVPPVVNISCTEVKSVKTGSEADRNLQPGETYYCISFSDNGIGFDQEYAGKIFELFQRLHSQNQYSGTGLGLAICKKIVQNHGGHIEASSKVDEGAVFRVYLPATGVLQPAES